MEVSNKNGGGRQTEKSFKAAQRADLGFGANRPMVDEFPSSPGH